MTNSEINRAIAEKLFSDSFFPCDEPPPYATDIFQAIGAAHAALLFWGIEIEIIGSATIDNGETLEAKWKVGANYPTINEQDQGFTGYNLVELGRLPAQMMLTILECLPAAIRAKEAALKAVEFMKWQDKPDKPGWWWCISPWDKKPHPVRLWSTANAARKHLSYTVSDAQKWRGHRWYGPTLEPPEDKP
jgi:hypothetical protein